MRDQKTEDAMTLRRTPSTPSARKCRGVQPWRAWLLVAAAVGLTPAAARAVESPEAYSDRDIPAALGSAVILSDADAAAQKGTGLGVLAPSIGLLQGPAVRLWDELKVQPQGGQSATVTITIGRPGQ